MTEIVQRQPKRLADYQPPSFFIRNIDLTFELSANATKVTSALRFERNTAGPLQLDGQQLTLQSIQLDGTALTPEQYQLTAENLTLHQLPDQGLLELVTLINPVENTALEGLYLADGVYCTQCEAEGFRRITYYPDRPDVLAVFSTTIIADKQVLPFLLSNGNKISEELLADGRSVVRWQDPFPKPAYLFALVAGDFDCLTDHFVTASGRSVLLECYVQKGDLVRSEFAMASLKRAMRWDEIRFDLEYDLDRYMVVAVDFFNMGAMENKGLNVFNSKFVLADAQSATDQDYFNIESIISHEYFHNWTGNRVTCRDWFQLSLKEGLTVFRDQEFSADMGSPTLNRIDAVKVMRTAQFAEDASPMAHPIRPEQVIEMNNFYTVTVYDKGAEVIRMLQTILGKEEFAAGLKLYLQRHDGQAVTCDDFVQAMQDASGIDLMQFRRWYNQAGTPELTVKQQYDAALQRLTLHISQFTPATAEQPEKLPLLIPVRIELLYPDNTPSRTELLLVNEQQQQFQLDHIPQQPLVVWLEDFSAPVKLYTSYQATDLLTIARSASNGLACWDAMQQYWSLLIAEAIKQQQTPTLSDELITVFRGWLQQPLTDRALTAELLTLPDFDTLAGQYSQIPVTALLQNLTLLQQQIAISLQAEFAACYQLIVSEPYQYSEQAVANRALKRRCLGYLALTAEGENWVAKHYQQADNMTDRLAALQSAQAAALPNASYLLEQFVQQYHANVQVMDKYSNLVAVTQGDNVFIEMQQVTERTWFSWKNPNRIRALYSAFSQRNPKQFHRADGKGYQLLADVVSKLDSVNPQLAARLLTPLLSWRRYDETRQQQLIAMLSALLAQPGLSDDVFEKVSKSLP